MHALFITAEDICKLYGVSLRHAQRIHREVRAQLTPAKAIGKGRIKPTLTIAEYCEVRLEPFKDIYLALRGSLPETDAG